MKNLCSLATISIFILFYQSVQAAETNIDKAVTFLKDACVNSGSSFELKISGKGQFLVQKLFGTGVAGSVNLSKKELEGFADAASALNAKQATEMRACMRPHIDKILGAILNDK